MSNTRVHLFISGRVQGVNYRRFTRREAVTLGLKGWVRNLPDRRVEAVFEGEETAVDELVRRCWKGPWMAIVRDIQVRKEPPTGDYTGFTVKR